MSPVVLSRAASSPCFPPGTQTSCRPSTSGAEAYPQPNGVGSAAPPPIGLTSPPSSRGRFLRHRSLPVADSTQTRSPKPPSAYSSSPSTVGVAFGPTFHLFPGHVNNGPSFAAQ